MSISCRRPLLNICADTTRIVVFMGSCVRCSPEIVHLRIEQAGCVEVEEYCEEVTTAVGCFCGEPVAFTDTRIKHRVIPKASVTYPLHEITPEGSAVFILDSKLAALGSGRYIGIISFGACGDTIIDINYTCGTTRLNRIVAVNSGES